MSYYPDFSETPRVPAVGDFDHHGQLAADEEFRRLLWWEQLLFRWRGQVSIGERQPEGFSGPMEFFLIKCEKCGPVLAYPHGYEERIDCEKCRLEWLREHQKTRSVS